MVNRSLSPGTFFRQKGFNRIGLLMNCLATVQLFSYLINTIQGLECNQLPKPHYSVLSSRMGPRMATDSGRQATPVGRNLCTREGGSVSRLGICARAKGAPFRDWFRMGPSARCNVLRDAICTLYDLVRRYCSPFLAFSAFSESSSVFCSSSK